MPKWDKYQESGERRVEPTVKVSDH
jgi:hypothetical protein